MNVQDDLHRLFPRYRTQARGAAWESLKGLLPLGSLARGVVVARYPFGVFVDIDAGFPALILVVRLRGADRHPYTDIERYPSVGSAIEGRVYAFADAQRQVGLTQLDGESLLGEA